MRRRLFLTAVLLLMLLAVRPIHAQTPPAWPPDPAVIFAEGVEVVKVEEILPYYVEQHIATKTACGRIVNSASAAAIIKRNGGFVICEMATGKLSQPVFYVGFMPLEQDIDGYGLEMSPDNKWALFDEPTARDDIHRLIAYELTTDKFNDLGIVPHVSGWVSQRGWATNMDWFIIDDGMPEWSSAYAYVATIPHENSMRMVLQNMRLPVVYFDNPPRLEAWFTPSNVSQIIKDDFDCELSIYYFLTHSITIYHTGKLCVPDYGPAHGDGYCRDVQPDGKAWLTRFNPITRERKKLYYGELEHIYWVSEDEAYALVMLDNNGKIDCKPGYDLAWGYETSWYDITNPTIALIELESGNILYSVPGSADLADGWPWSVLGHENSLITPIDARSLIINFPASLYPQNMLIRIENGAAKVDMLDGATTLVVDKQHLVLERDTGEGATATYQYVLYNIFRQTSSLIVNKTNAYWFAFNKRQDGSIIISVKSRNASMRGENAPEEIKYMVELPTLNN